MSTRKQRRKEARDGGSGSPAPKAAAGGTAPAAPRKHAAPAPPPQPPADPEAEWKAQRFLAVVGFAVVGLLMGFLTGANLPIDVADAGFSLGQAARVGGAIAGHSAAVGQGLGAGVLGLLVGGTFGYSLFLTPGLMFLSWVGGSVGLVVGLMTGMAVVGGVGWAGGFLAVLLTALKVKLGGP